MGTVKAYLALTDDLVRVKAHLAVFRTPQEAERQAAPEFAARGLVADAAELPHRPGDCRRVSRRALPRAAERPAGKMAAEAGGVEAPNARRSLGLSIDLRNDRGSPAKRTACIEDREPVMMRISRICLSRKTPHGPLRAIFARPDFSHWR
jgi:pyruvate/2-oxoglutarate dehydrogenase complex dihydrolipoamide acyltransferase (E2) component